MSDRLDYIAKRYAEKFVRQLIDSSDYLLEDCVSQYEEADVLESTPGEFGMLVNSVRSLLDDSVTITIK